MMGKILAVVFLMVAAGAAYGIKSYLPVLRGQALAEAKETRGERPAVGFQKASPAGGVECSAQAGRKICKVAKPDT